MLGAYFILYVVIYIYFLSRHSPVFKSFKDPVAVGVCVKTPSSSTSTGATDKIIMNIKAVQRFILTAAGIFPMPKFMVSFFIWYLFYFIFPVGCIIYLLMIHFSRRMQSFNWVLQPLMWSYQQDKRIFLLVPGGAHSCQVWYRPVVKCIQTGFMTNLNFHSLDACGMMMINHQIW